MEARWASLRESSPILDISAGPSHNTHDETRILDTYSMQDYIFTYEADTKACGAMVSRLAVDSHDPIWGDTAGRSQFQSDSIQVT